MTPQDMARIYQAAFTHERPWSPQEIGQLIAAPGAITATAPQGFAIGRVALDEAEILTIAVDPAAQRLGHGRALLKQIEGSAAAAGAQVLFLEVAAGNTAAIVLYGSREFEQVGIRPRYYSRQGSLAVDAIVMQKLL